MTLVLGAEKLTVIITCTSSVSPARETAVNRSRSRSLYNLYNPMGGVQPLIDLALKITLGVKNVHISRLVFKALLILHAK
jgi:hypothetical protein